jgi:D-alanine-D-alanine ligase
MLPEVAIVYNEPCTCAYVPWEEKAVLGVLETVDAVYKALVELGYPVSVVPLLPPIARTRDVLKALRADLVFNLFEGFDGSPETEAVVAGIISEIGLAYTGCPPPALSLALDKSKAKDILRAAGIKTPNFQVLTPDTLCIFSLTYPCIIKPCGEDASHGLTEESVVNDADHLVRQVARVSGLFGGRALVEEFVDGREFNVTVLGSDNPVVLPISEIVYTLPPGMPELLTFSAKWEPQTIYFEHTGVVCPAELNDDTREQIVDIALRAFRLLGCSGYARLDLRQNGGEPQVLEVNPNPDISPGTGAARQAQAVGMAYSQFIDRIVHLALEKSCL